MNSISFLALVEIITTFQLVFFGVFMVTYSQKRRLPSILLGLFLFSLAISYQQYVFENFSQFFIYEAPWAYLYWPLSFRMLIGPSLFLYVSAYLSKDFKLKLNHLFLLIPFALVVLYLTYHFHILPSEEKTRVFLGEYLFSWTEYITLMSALHIHTIIYLALVLRKVSTYQKGLTNHLSSLNKHNLSWLFLIVVGMFILWLMRFGNFWIWMIDQDSLRIRYDDLRLISALVFLTFSVTIVFRTLRQSDVFYPAKPKYSGNQINTEQKRQILEKLTSYMEMEKPFLNPELNLQLLSEGTGIPQHHISQVINTNLNQNFFDFVNEYRIKESKRLFFESSSKEKNISEIMFEVGFNSKSVFNTAFKKMTGMTPSEFRKSKSAA